MIVVVVRASAEVEDGDDEKVDVLLASSSLALLCFDVTQRNAPHTAAHKQLYHVLYERQPKKKIAFFSVFSIFCTNTFCLYGSLYAILSI